MVLIKEKCEPADNEPVNATSFVEAYPLSQGQAALWFQYKLAPNSAAYNLAGAAAVPVDTDLQALRCALRMVAERHPLLRTLFTELNGKPIQSVYTVVKVDFRVIDASKWTKAQLDDQLAEAIYRPFDLEIGPTWRVVVFHRAPVSGTDDWNINRDEHLVLLTLHHIIADLWSMAIIMSEVAAFYRQETTGNTASLKPLKFTYADHVQNEQQQLSGLLAEKSWNYWQNVLTGELPPLSLQTDRPHPAETTGRGSAHSILLDKQLTDKLKSLATKQNIPLYTVLLTAFQTLLYRYTGQNNITVGFPKIGRSSSTARLVGYFVNQMVINASLSDSLSFIDLMSRVDKTLEKSSQHDWYPYPLLVQRLRPDRELNRSPLIQAVFSWQQAPRLIPRESSSQFVLSEEGQAVDLGGLMMRPVNLPFHVAPFELVMLASAALDGLMITIEYAIDLFDATTIAHMAARYQTLLESITADPELPVSKLNILPESERKILVEAWNDTDAFYPSESCLHQLFEQQVERTPEVTAVSSGNDHLTYLQLNQKANQLAHYFRGLSISLNSLVAVYLEPSVQMIWVLLGILKAGGCYIPLDPNNPKERLAFMLNDAHPDLVITSQRLQVNLPDFTGGPFITDADEDLLATQPLNNPSSNITSDHPAYVIYTSGSTGQPKGAILAHRGVVNLLVDFQRRQAIAPGESCSWWTSSSFDVSIYEIFSPLLAGGSLHVIPENIRLDASSLFEWLQAHRIRSAFLPAFFLEDFLAWIQTHTGNLSLNRLLVGVEPIPDTLLTSIHALLPSLAIINGYGPTEATICSTLYPVQDVSPHPGNTPIGKPVANTQIYLLDQYLQPIPIGLVGEVYIGGVGLAHGYLNRPDLTSQRFLQSPFRVGDRLYRTGDLARYLPDGNLLYVGRVDTQIKLHGVRIELGEIEANLLQYPGVKQAVVQLHEQPSGGKQLIAYITTSQDPPPSPEELRTYLRQRLPASMIPTRLMVLDALPLTTTGKVNRKALPLPEILQIKNNATPQAPQVGVEQILASIWERVLSVEHLGRNDNFFKLGGDSILSLQIVALAAEAGIQIKPHHIFQAPTIAELAALAKSTEPLHKLPTPTGTAGDIPLTPIEHWFFQQGFSNPHHWNQSLIFIPSRPLDPRHLRSAVSALLQQHDALRFRFKKNPDGWQQIFSEPADEIPFEVINVSSLSDTQREAIIDEQVSALQASLNIFTGPLMRVVYFSIGENLPGRLLIVIHHLAVDAVSWRILLDDLQRAYLQLECSQPVQLPAKTTAFHIWARQLAEHAQSAKMIHEADFWQRMVEKYKAIRKDNPFICEKSASQRGPEDSARRVSVSLTERETYALLHQPSDASGTEINDLLLTALVRAFQQLSNKKVFCIDLESHGREEIFSDIDLSRTVGWFTTLYPIILELPLNSRLDQSIKSIKEQLHRIPYHGLGYGILRYLSQDPKIRDRLKDVGPAPVSFNYLGQLPGIENGNVLSGLTPESPRYQRNPDAQRPHSIEINAAIYHGELSVEWIYSSHVHYRFPIERLAGTFIDELRALIAHCRSVERIGYTPTDFPGVDLSQSELDTIVRMYSGLKTPESRHNIEAIYPLSPMQQGMIFHTLYTPESGIYFEQTAFTIQGHFDVSRFKHAWQLLLDRHTILRTSFVWQGLDRVLQVVHRRVQAPITEKDWREVTEPKQQDRFDHLLVEERQRGFNLSIPPLLRLDILQTHDDKYTLLLNYHHALLDGWSVSLLFEEVFALYNAIVRQKDLKLTPTRPYREYIAWLQTKDLVAAESFWRKELENYVPLSLSPIVESPSPPTGALQPIEQNERLSIPTTSALQEFARQHNLTINTLVQGAWSILLSHYLHRDDVLFGVTVSGRSSGLPGLLTMIGLFINTLPLRVHLNPTISLIEWLQYIQSKAIEIQQFDYSPLAQIQNWSGVPRNSPLFDTLLVFENYPSPIHAHEQGTSLSIGNFYSLEQTTYPITVAITPGIQLGLRVLFDPAMFDAVSIQHLLRQLEHALYCMPSNQNQSLSELNECIDHDPDGFGTNHSGKHKTAQIQAQNSPAAKHAGMRLLKEDNLSKEGQDSPQGLALENYLTHQWKKVLNVEKVELNDNFFQLGGDSLKAAICTYQIQNAMHEKIPLVAIFEDPTIHEYAQYLEQNYPTGIALLLGIPTQAHKQVIKDLSTTTLVPIQPNGGKLPLFCIHPAGGIVFPYYVLSAFFEKDRPLYGIQDPSLYNTTMDPESIESMAEHYIKAIKTVQPDGPYNLFGWSAGGVLAFEMARQLYEQGQQVAKLIIVDTAAPGVKAKNVTKSNGQDFLRHLLARLKTLPDQILIAPTTIKPFSSYIRSGLYLLAAVSKHDGSSSEEKPKLSALLGWVRLDTWRALLLGRDTELERTISQEQSLLLIRMPDVIRILKMVRMHQQLVKRYAAKNYPGKIILFLGVHSNREQVSHNDSTLGWETLADEGVEVHVINANHVGLFAKPHIQELADKLKTCLNGKG